MKIPCLIIAMIWLCFLSESAAQTNAQNSFSEPISEQPQEIASPEKEKKPKPAFELIAAGEVEKVKEKLKEEGLDFYAHNDVGETALTLAIQNEDVEMVKLLAKEAVINLKNEEGETPLTLAIKKGNLEIISLVAKRAKASLKNNFGEAPLFLAVEQNDLFLMEELIEKGAEVNRKSNGATPLSHATRGNNFKAAAYLVKAGAVPNQPNDNGNIPLFIAIDNGFDVLAGMLITKSPDPVEDANWRTEIDERLLNIAIVKSHPEIVKILLNAGAEANDLDYFENSALHIAAAVGEVEIAQILLQYGVELNGRNLKGETPLMVAAKNGQGGLVQFLIQNGADPKLRDYRGYSVQDSFDLGSTNKGENSKLKPSVLSKNNQPKEFDSAKESASISNFPGANN